MTTLTLCLAAYLTFNLLVFCVYWWDKEAARKGGRRIRESTLLWLAFIGGSAGAVCAQRLLRHKTRKEPFCSILISIIVLHAGVLISLAIMSGWLVR